MNTAAGSLIAFVITAVAFWFGIRWMIGTLSKYRGKRVVTCPENGRPSVVELDALHASLTSTVGLPDVRLENCWRWPMKEQCGQECLVDLDVAPGQCLVSGVLTRWFRGKNCVYCNYAIPDLHWIDHHPALLSPGGKLRTWLEVNQDNIWDVLETHMPVCWNCYIAQKFRLDHPDLVVYRPWLKGIPGGADGPSASHRI
jgi:hypothetical protein